MYKDKLANDPEYREKRKVYLKKYYKKNREAILAQQKANRTGREVALG